MGRWHLWPYTWGTHRRKRSVIQPASQPADRAPHCMSNNLCRLERCLHLGRLDLMMEGWCKLLLPYHLGETGRDIARLPAAAAAAAGAAEAVETG